MTSDDTFKDSRVMQDGLGVPFAPLRSPAADALDCYSRSLPGEPRFTLLGRDPHAPAVIRHWANMREYEGESVEKVNDARGIAQAMEEYRASLVKIDPALELVRVTTAKAHAAEEEGALRRLVRRLKGG